MPSARSSPPWRNSVCPAGENPEGFALGGDADVFVQQARIGMVGELAQVAVGLIAAGGERKAAEEDP